MFCTPWGWSGTHKFLLGVITVILFLFIHYFFAEHHDHLNESLLMVKIGALLIGSIVFTNLSDIIQEVIRNIKV